MFRLKSAFRVSQRQLTWALAGLVVVIVTAVIAAGNLRVIYRAEPDFVLGSFLAVAAYCFAKATTRTSDERVLEELHRTGALQRLRLAQRDVSAAMRRLTTYYHSQAESLDFVAGLDLYEVIFDDIDEALANIDGVMQILGVPEEQSVTYEIEHVSRQLLLRHSRGVREALNRQRKIYEWLIVTVRPGEQPGIWDRFGNMTSDLLKAHFAMRMLCARPLRVAPDEQSIELIGYLEVSYDRAVEFADKLRVGGFKPPEVLDTLLTDLEGAKKALLGARLALPGSHQAAAP